MSVQAILVGVLILIVAFGVAMSIFVYRDSKRRYGKPSLIWVTICPVLYFVFNLRQMSDYTKFGGVGEISYDVARLLGGAIGGAVGLVFFYRWFSPKSEQQELAQK